MPSNSHHASACRVELLEHRRLMAIQGPVVAQQFIGTVDAVTAVVLHFDVPLDPATASNVNAYRMVRKFHTSGSDGFGGFGGSEGSNDSNRIQLSSANYDPVANTVTLHPVRASFPLRRSFTVIVVEGTGPDAIKQADGQVIDGDGNGKAGGDLNLRYKSRAGKSFNFKELDGDSARLRVTGPGNLFYFLPIRGRSSPSVFLRDTDTTTILSGTVKQGKRGNGTVNIAQVTDNDDLVTGQVTLADPPFLVRALPPTT
jgi:hypothetical protein